MTVIKFICRSIVLSIALVLGSSIALAAVTVDVKQGIALQKQGALLIDVRTPGEFAQGHAPGARLIPLDQLQQRLGELKGAKDQPIALICHSGNRSTVAQAILEKAGFSQTFNVAGGMVAWARAGLPVQTGLSDK